MRYLLSAVLALGLLPGVAPGQSDGEGPVGARESGSGSTGSTTELFFVVEELREEIRQLRGSVEETTHRLEQLNKRSRERYVDLDQRLVDISSRVADLEDTSESVNTGSGGGESADKKTGPAGSGDGESTGGSGGGGYREPGEAEREDYASIQYLIQEEKDYEKAIDEIYGFLDEYPEGDLTINAYYWLGELYLSLESYEQARQAFTIVTSRHKSHRKAPDALFKLAVAHDRADNGGQARKILDRLESRYPDSRSADLGRQYREEMEEE